MPLDIGDGVIAKSSPAAGLAGRPDGFDSILEVNPMPIDLSLAYDQSNIFARILRGEIPSALVYEDEFAVAFHDINPQAPVHILVVPRGPYVSWDDFTAKAPDAEVAGFMRAVGEVARQAGLVANGYRLLVNVGQHGHQEVPHLHVHIFGGRQFHDMVPPEK
ncbi:MULTISPECIES: histidine triad nucleotide-binding protein [unclassified Mesorhizobium]|uniref:histidine triad nucleotide-binding protein n=1 Tax=unclassified Mesorhizobium TaxID=325217 RepID=UPI001CC94B42|nr:MULTISPECIES: histidine triad nucleotide-binding protein [unclassified Mesorhizobium]MBZ9811128.1 histidine triad nucleotide-binding protein [Mesorhizobium sp. ESP-6-2]